MKNTYSYIFILCLIFSSLNAQKGSIILGLEGNYNLPVGTLSDRFNAGIGGTFYVGTQASDDWTWVGKVSYLKLDDENTDKLFKKVEAEVNEQLEVFDVPLDGLTLELTVVGLSAEAKYNILRSGIFETDLNLGFGFYYWESSRSEYREEVFIEDAQGEQVPIANFDVPRLFQKDWSGALNFGLDININIIESLWFTTSSNYSLLITELWPTLALDLENVSGLQYFNFRSGFRIKL